jgi:hypothetical protein
LKERLERETWKRDLKERLERETWKRDLKERLVIYKYYYNYIYREMSEISGNE